MFLEAARRLTGIGWQVFPVARGSKIPAIPKDKGGRGCLDATADMDIIRAWARDYRGANIGVACGVPSNVLVIDFDPRNGSEAAVEALAAKGCSFRPTVTAKTAGGGRHLYYRYEPLLKNSKSALAKGIDIKTTGGYVVAPPSRIDATHCYEWVSSPLGGELPRLPMWVVEKMRPRPEPVRKEFKNEGGDASGLVKFVASAGAGNRNNALYWAAMTAIESKVMTSGVASAMVEAAVASGLDRTEAMKTVNSAQRKQG